MDNQTERPYASIYDVRIPKRNTFRFSSLRKRGIFNGIANEISLQFRWAPIFYEIEIQFRRILLLHEIEFDFVLNFVTPSFTTANEIKFSIISARNERRQIDGRLHSVGDTVYIPDLGYNGTIVSFTALFAKVIPHDYGHPIRRLFRNLRAASGISNLQRYHLQDIGVILNDNTRITGGTLSSPSRPNYNYRVDENSLSQLFYYHNIRVSGKDYYVHYEYE